jgi:FAD/FMN-containing dehydrogenase
MTALLRAPAPALLERFAAIVGARYAVTDTAAQAPYLIEPRGRYPGRTPMVLRPGATEEVAAILKLANETRTPIVPQGGNTGLVGGQTPHETGNEIVLSLGRLDRLRNLDAEANTMTVEAGMTLANARAAAAKADRLFPLSLASEGTCQIGGNLATNAGGTAVLAYGTMRDLTLGLEVVLASGEIWNGLRALHKDNTGYDLRDIFVGSEGTLAIITAAVLKLYPRPRGTALIFAGLPNLGAVLRLLNNARATAGRDLTAFEFMARIGLDFVLRHLPDARDPLSTKHEWYVLAGISSLISDDDARERAEALLAAASEADIVSDAVIAASLAQAGELWRLREALSEVQKHEGGSIKHDVSLPVERMANFIAEASAAALKVVPGARIVPFGHLGDGNVHFNVSQPIGADREAFLARWDEVNEAVHAIVAHYDGSISGEHGIGRAKRHLLTAVKSPVEIALMRKLKAALDPNGILNPGKLL